MKKEDGDQAVKVLEQRWERIYLQFSYQILLSKAYVSFFPEIRPLVLVSRFEQAISAGRVSAVQKIENCCVLAAVGQGMVERKGSAATMMSALANADINIKAIAQVGRPSEGGVTDPSRQA